MEIDGIKLQKGATIVYDNYVGCTISIKIAEIFLEHKKFTDGLSVFTFEWLKGLKQQQPNLRIVKP